MVFSNATSSTPTLDAVRPVVVARPQAEVPRKPSFEPAEVVVANHTAVKLNGGLRTAYAIQSIRTGLPLMLIDLAVTSWSLLVVTYFINLSLGLAFSAGMWLQLAALLLLQVGLISLHQLYPGAGVSPVNELRGVVRSTVIACLCLSAMNVLFGELTRVEFMVFASTAICISLLLPFARYCARGLLGKTRWWGIRTILIGSHREGQRICARMRAQRSSGLILVGYVSTADKLQQCDNETGLLRTIDDAFSVACMHRAPAAAIASTDTHYFTYRLMFQFPFLMWIGNSGTDVESSDLLGACNKQLRMPFLRFVPRFCKRAIDLTIVIPGLIVLAVPMGMVGLAIKILSPGPIFYASLRVGQHGRNFKMWKFRSMVMNAEEVLKQHLKSDPEAREEWERDSKIKSDPRIIPRIGNLLRRWSLDELPQLWNVLMGEMSLVGPRAVLPNEIVRYQKHYYEYTQMLPGITGLWQVSGRNETTFETRVFLVHHYAANWSLWLDAYILAKTPITVLTRRGAY